MPHKILQSRIFVWQPWALLAPALLTLVALVIVPFVQTLHLAFSHDPHGFVPAQAGATLENFWILMGDSGWWRSVRPTVIFALGSVIVEAVLGVCFPIILQKLNTLIRGIMLEEVG